jgi:hypothetical protein
VAMVFVNFKDIVCIKYTRDTLMKWDDLFGVLYAASRVPTVQVFTILFIFSASFGGIFGLCIGGSVISFIEFIYFFTFKFLSNLKRRHVISAKPMYLKPTQKNQLNVNKNYNYRARIDYLQRPPINRKTIGKYEGKYLP